MRCLWRNKGSNGNDSGNMLTCLSMLFFAAYHLKAVATPNSWRAYSICSTNSRLAFLFHFIVATGTA